MKSIPVASGVHRRSGSPSRRQRDFLLNQHQIFIKYLIIVYYSNMVKYFIAYVILLYYIRKIAHIITRISGNSCTRFPNVIEWLHECKKQSNNRHFLKSVVKCNQIWLHLFNAINRQNLQIV